MKFRRIVSRSSTLVLILLAVAALRPGTAWAQETCAAQCHASLFLGKHAHPPTESCDSCHEAVNASHPQAGKKTFKLSQEVPQLCFACHDELGKKSDVHPPVKDGMCVTCHDPHSSNEAKLLTQPLGELCAACHSAALDSKMPHQPVAAGECGACHAPHESDHPKLLVASFPAALYAPYTESEYELCFSCHARDLLRDAETSTASGFRDGQRNLHFLHVNNAQKGRSCKLCHNVHGSNSAALIAESVPFGKWRLPLKFVKTENGGSCAPGCHKPQVYDRKNPGQRNRPSAVPSSPN